MTVQPTRKFTRKLITALLAACLLPVALPMLPATAAPTYKPPKRKAAQRTEGSGNRGSDNSKCPRDFTLLMPTTTPDTIPETTLATPFLYVYLDKPQQLVVTLDRYPDPGSTTKPLTPVGQENRPPVQSGLVKIAYPANQPPLEIGKTYIWRVKIDCGQASDGVNRIVSSSAKADVSRVAEPPGLQTKLQLATSARQRAEIYAQAGLWPEALTAIAEARAGGKDTAADQDFQALLNQIGLKQIDGAIVRPEKASPSPVAQPVVAPSPSASVIPTPTPKVPVPAKPADPKKPCH